MERKSNLCKSSKVISNSIGKEIVLHVDEVKSIGKESTTEAQRGKTMETSCQTDIEEIFGNSFVLLSFNSQPIQWYIFHIC